MDNSAEFLINAVFEIYVVRDIRDNTFLDKIDDFLVGKYFWKVELK